MPKRSYEKHNGTKTREYRIWYDMRRRCSDPKQLHYDRYGGRGIKVCPQWERSFATFIRDMGTPEVAATLERKDNNLGYSKENCRWATRWEQSINRNNNVMMTVGGVTKPLAQWVVEKGLPYDLVYWRKYRGGWSDEDCLAPSTKPIPISLTWNGQTFTLRQIAQRLGISYQSVSIRVAKGWPVEEIINRPNSQPYMKKFHRPDSDPAKD